MPRIYDNRALRLTDGLSECLASSTHADFCVGYFNLRGWDQIVEPVAALRGKQFASEEGEPETRYCRLLIGMQKLPQEFIRERYSRLPHQRIDGALATKLKRRTAEQFREQLMVGGQTNQAEEQLQKLLGQLKEGRVVVKIYLKHLLHAKLYLAHRQDRSAPIIGFLGSSNLTLAGLSGQGELNIDVVDEDAALKLARWFEDYWQDQWCLDITKELIQVLEESWIAPHSPYQIYLKMLYHMSREARGGISEYKIPKAFQGKLLRFQEEAVLRAAKMLNTRGGVVIGDVVGLGKTITAAALVKIFEEGHRLLIICPVNLVQMWEDYDYEYDLGARIVPLSRITQVLPDLKAYNLIIVDESHNLRNTATRRYQALLAYVELLQAKFILLSATPYNKAMTDLSAQLRLFVKPDQDLGIAPERYIEQLGGRPQFGAKHEGAITAITAFEKSDAMEDWRQLMRLYLVRRSRSFVKENFAETDPETGRRYLLFADGRRSYFPDRKALKVEYLLTDNDPYGKLYSDDVVETINSLDLPRYGLGLDVYLHPLPNPIPTKDEAVILANLGKAGARLKGFARTNLFKRLESSGYAFLLSLSRHILRNYLFVYAIEHGKPLPIGQQDMGVLDNFLEDQDTENDEGNGTLKIHFTADEYKQQAQSYYDTLSKGHADSFDWVSAHLFSPILKKRLQEDAVKLAGILKKIDGWSMEEDRKLQALYMLLVHTHAREKVLVFTQFSDTAFYIEDYLKRIGMEAFEVVTGETSNPQEIAKNFSPVSNGLTLAAEAQTRVLITTDVLSEGQNLQDAHIIVNYDLPWAIIRIIQRAGRIDRIGQQSDKILCYSFLPEHGIEKIIKLRSRLKDRLEQSDEVLGSPDEVFFEDQQVRSTLQDLYAQNDSALEEREDDVDLASQAYQLWQEAEKAHPLLARQVQEMPNVVYATRAHFGGSARDGAIVYMQQGPDADMLTWIDSRGQVITTNQERILQAARCEPSEPALPRQERHHDLVTAGTESMLEAMQTTGGQLGRPSSIRYKLYHRLKEHYDRTKNGMFPEQELLRVCDQIYSFPLREYAREVIARQMKAGVRDHDLATLAKTLYEEERLCIVSDEDQGPQEPTVICSLGMVTL